MRTAAIELATSHGTEAASAPAIARRAGLLPEQALAHYATVDECLTSAYDEGFRRLVAVCLPALTGRGTWQQRLLAACDAALAAFAECPRLARFCMVEAWRTSLPRLSRQRTRARERLIALLAEHRPLDAEADLPGLRIEMFAGAAHHAIGEQLQHPACSARAIRTRFHQVVGTFEPTRTSHVT